jgi:hypothetical protein
MTLFGATMISTLRPAVWPAAFAGALLGGVISIPLLSLRRGVFFFLGTYPLLTIWLLTTQQLMVSASALSGFFLGISAFGLLLMSYRARREADGMNSVGLTQS